MAERRMFTKKITESDAFLDMPLSAQALYFHINMAADDEGFVNNPRKIQRMVGASEDDLKLLILKNFLITYETGVIVIKHWKMHNYIQKDRFHPTVYQEERQILKVKENGAYTIDGDNMYTERIQDAYKMDTEVRLGKESIGKDNNISSLRSDILSSSEAEHDDSQSVFEEIISYLNEKTGKSFRWQTKSTQRNINGRLSDGYTVDDFKKVIDNKCTEWLGNKDMCNYLRPETLFLPGHFESYLNQSDGNDDLRIFARAGNDEG